MGRTQTFLTLKQTVHIRVVTGVLQTVKVILHFTFRSLGVIALGNDIRSDPTTISSFSGVSITFYGAQQ
jgi:hypothetical protein